MSERCLFGDSGGIGSGISALGICPFVTGNVYAFRGTNVWRGTLVSVDILVFLLMQKRSTMNFCIGRRNKKHRKEGRHRGVFCIARYLALPITYGRSSGTLHTDRPCGRGNVTSLAGSVSFANHGPSKMTLNDEPHMVSSTATSQPRF